MITPEQQEDRSLGEKAKQTSISGKSTDSRFLLNSHFFTGKIIFLGIAVAQIISTIHVFLSNRELFHYLEKISGAGYLVVPNQNVMGSLNEFAPAFYGGLFFTLSVGALLSVLGLFSAMMWDRIFKRKKVFILFFLILWAGIIGEVNRKGFCPLISAYFLFIPSIVFLTALRFMPTARVKNRFSAVVRIIPPLLIGVLWMLQIDSGVFTNIRDHLLFSNSLGTEVNDFYYRYTLYPAEAIKTLDQKIIKTYRLDNFSDNNLANRIREKLINYDFLEMVGNTAVDLRLGEENSLLSLSNNGRIIMTSSKKDFLSNTEKILNEFSTGIDRLNFFRRFTFISILTGFPAVMIIFFYSILALALNAFFDYKRSCNISLFLCLIIAFSLSAFFYYSSEKRIQKVNLPDSFMSPRWHERVKALKIISENKMDITRFGNYRDLLSSPHIPVRYWLAKALGTGRDSESYGDILTLLDDPCPNVVCMAYYSLGQRGEKRAVGEILKRIRLSGHWYEQWYAYKALRTLGWKQRASE